MYGDSESCAVFSTSSADQKYLICKNSLNIEILYDARVLI
jgi:hypothetical protein